MTYSPPHWVGCPHRKRPRNADQLKEEVQRVRSEALLHSTDKEWLREQTAKRRAFADNVSAVASETSRPGPSRMAQALAKLMCKPEDELLDIDFDKEPAAVNSAWGSASAGVGSGRTGLLNSEELTQVSQEADAVLKARVGASLGDRPSLYGAAAVCQ